MNLEKIYILEKDGKEFKGKFKGIMRNGHLRYAILKGEKSKWVPEEDWKYLRAADD